MAYSFYRTSRVGAREWSGAEIACLKRLYPTATRAELEAALPIRTWTAIQMQACKMCVRRRRDWKAVVARHVPVFGLPTDVKVKEKLGRVWS